MWCSVVCWYGGQETRQERLLNFAKAVKVVVHYIVYRKNDMPGNDL